MSHKLSGWINRCVHQVEECLEFVQTTSPCLPEDEEHPLKQHLLKSTVTMLQSYAEEYLRCIVSAGTFWKAPIVRNHLASSSQDPDRIFAMPFPEVAREAQGHVSFERGATKLKAIFTAITGGSPFADLESEQQWLDLVLVRNIIAHAGGWPTERHVATARSPNAVISSKDIGGVVFHRLRIRPQFFADTVNGILRSIQATEARLELDPDFKLD